MTVLKAWVNLRGVGVAQVLGSGAPTQLIRGLPS